MIPSAEDPRLDARHALVGGAPELLGPWQLELLVSLGLRPDHALLDLGCGTLRGGLHFIEYLAAGRYTGAEPSADLLAIGRELLARSNLGTRRAELLSLDELSTRSGHFDWILTQSVLNHLDEADVIRTVDRVHAALANDGCWVSTICFDPSVPTVEPGAAHGRRAGEYWRSRANPAWFRSLLLGRRLAFALVTRPQHPRGMDVFVARRLRG